MILRLTLCLLLIGLGESRAESPADTLPAEAVADFQWFGTLGFPDVHDCPLALVATGRFIQSDEKLHAIPIDAFLLRHADDGSFRVLTFDLFTRDFATTKPGTPEHQRVGYEECPLAAEADDYYKYLTQPPGRESDEVWRRFGESISERTETFVWAWACWRNGLDDRAARLYAHAAAMPVRFGHKEPETASFRERLERDLGLAMIWRATLDFGDPKIPRTQLLDAFERVAHNYPRAEHAALARDTADRLRTMVAEDAEHAAHPTEPLADLPMEQRVTELIFRLRDQNGHQVSQPGSCNVFDDFGGALSNAEKATDPAHQLARIGFPAVPALIAALDDKRFSRSVGFWRDFAFSHHVLTVGDCAVQILERIAGRSFFIEKTTSSYPSKDGDVPAVRAQVQAWWQDIQKKGEKQTVVDTVRQGGSNAVREARGLCKSYPADALLPMIQGAKNSSGDSSRRSLVYLIGELPGDDAVPFLLEELHAGPHLSDRHAAAEGLQRHGHAGEAIDAMMQEWERLHIVKPSQEDEQDNLPQGVIAFLVWCNRLRAIDALQHDLPQRRVRTRLDVVEAVMYPSESFHPPAADGDDPAELDAARETLLASELDDTAERFGMSASMFGKSVNDPRVCDVAALALSERYKGRYTFDITGTLPERDRQRRACLNLWRDAHALAPLPPPPEHSTPPAPGETVRPLAQTFADADDAARPAAEAALLHLGPPALPPLRTFADTLPAADPRRARLNTVATLLACTVVDATLEIASPADEIWRQTLQDRLDTLKGAPLTSAAFIALISDLGGRLQQGVNGIDLRAIRDGDGGGVRITLKVLGALPQAGPIYSWEGHMSVALGNKMLESSTGQADPYVLQLAAHYEQDYAKSVDRALDAPGDPPFQFIVYAAKGER